MSEPTSIRERLLLLMADGELWEARRIALRLNVHDASVRLILNELNDKDLVEVKRYKRKSHMTCKPAHKWRLK